MNNPIDPHPQAPLFGTTRTRLAARHALITSDGFVPSLWPGAQDVEVIFHITPAIGAAFTQARLTWRGKGLLPLESQPGIERFLYLLEGEVLGMGDLDTTLCAGSFAYLPPGAATTLTASGPAVMILFEKRYEPLPGVSPPPVRTGLAGEIPAEPFLGQAKALLSVLLPPDLAYDMAVNLFTYQPGTTLPFVETHVMEHGLLMLSGQGVYRLEDQWYPVRVGDVIWMGPYCPQWFVAMGETPASYLYYKNINRLPSLP